MDEEGAMRIADSGHACRNKQDAQPYPRPRRALLPERRLKAASQLSSMLPSEQGSASARGQLEEEQDDKESQLLHERRSPSAERPAPSPASRGGAIGEDVEAARPRRTCRFCLGEEGEDPSLGKLFTPCLCRDTVHSSCLNQWRMTTSSAFYK